MKVWLIYLPVAVMEGIIGLWLLYTAGLFIRKGMEFASLAKATSYGTIVRNDERLWRSHVMYFPVIEFFAGTKTIQFTADIGRRGRPMFRTGDKVRIFYCPERPQLARISRYDTSLTGGLFGLIGLGFVVLSITMFIQLL